jgi:methionyl-tRNA formyltransferase
MGTPDFSVPVLEALVEAGHEVVAVYCQPPRPAGRGKKERPSPVQRVAEALGLPVYCPLNFKSEEDRAVFAAHDADVAVVVAYGLILPQAVLDAPKAGCLNIHASLLPRWRGAAPIHRAIMAGDGKTGVCIMQMEAGLDTGPVLLRAETEIAAGDTTGSLHDRLSGMGAALVVEALERLEGLEPELQPDVGVTYAEKISKDEARIDWTRPAAKVDCHIRGLSPFPGAWTWVGGERIKVLLSCVSDGTGGPGEVLHDGLTVACGSGAVRLLRLQRAGKGAMEQGDFLRGFPVAKGTVLGG